MSIKILSLSFIFLKTQFILNHLNERNKSYINFNKFNIYFDYRAINSDKLNQEHELKRYLADTNYQLLENMDFNVKIPGNLYSY